MLTPASISPAAPKFTVTPQADGQMLIAWADTGAADYRVYAAELGQGYRLVGICIAGKTSILYDAPPGIAVYVRVYADSPNGSSGTLTVGPIIRPAAQPASPAQPAKPLAAANPLPQTQASQTPTQLPTPAPIRVVCAGAQVPAVVHVDLIGAMGTPSAAADLPMLQTDFGDAAGTYNALPGFTAAHLYTRPGTYTITGRITCQSSGTLAQTTTTTAATVTIAPDQRRYIHASAAGDDANAGSLLAPVKTFARAIALASAGKPASIASAGVLFRRGDVFDFVEGATLPMTNARFADYGDAALPPPRLRYAGPRLTAAGIFTPAPDSRDVIIQNLAFDSIYGADADSIGNLTAVQPAGSNIAVVNCLFLNLSSAVNCQSRPDGVLVQDCRTPQITAMGTPLPSGLPDTTSPGITGTRAYTVYVEGSHVAILGNIVADSTREHCIRVGGCSGLLIFGNDLQNLDRAQIDPSNIAKGTLPVQVGDHLWVAGNIFRNGPAGIGPLNRLDLLHSAQATTSGIPDPFPADFYRVDAQVDGDTGEYTVFTGQRGTATVSAYGAPSRAAQFRNVGKKTVKLLHSIESITLPVTSYINLLAYDDLAKQRLGINEVTRQIKEFKRRFANLRVAAMTSALFKGQIYFDAAGNLLPGSSGAATTVDYGIPAGNIGHLDPFNTGTPIVGGTAWNNATANIDQQLQALLQAAVQLTGYELKHAFYGKNIPHYLTSNTNLGNYFYRNSDFNPGFVQTADIPNPLLGLTWHKAYYSFFEDQNGVRQPMVGDDQILFTPDPSADWIGVLEGSYAVPTDVGRISSNEASVVEQMRIAHGLFAYGRQIDDPVTAKIVAGDTFLPAIKNPQAIYIATVV